MRGVLDIVPGMSLGSDAAVPATGPRTSMLGMAMVHTLVLQFLVGMANTFWLTVPDSGSGWKDNDPAWLLGVHMLLGVALLGLAVWIVVLARRTGDAVWLRASAIGIVGIVVAFVGGVWFMGKVDNDTASFIMAIGWALSLVGYATGLARSAPVR